MFRIITIICIYSVTRDGVFPCGGGGGGGQYNPLGPSPGSSQVTHSSRRSGEAALRGCQNVSLAEWTSCAKQTVVTP